MRCPSCHSAESAVQKSFYLDEQHWNSKLRRRQCFPCGTRFKTYEIREDFYTLLRLVLINLEGVDPLVLFHGHEAYMDARKYFDNMFSFFQFVLNPPPEVHKRIERIRKEMMSMDIAYKEIVDAKEGKRTIYTTCRKGRPPLHG